MESETIVSSAAGKLAPTGGTCASNRPFSARSRRSAVSNRPHSSSSNPVVKAHNRTVLSLDPETSKAPSGLNATPLMLSVCPDSDFKNIPVATRQTYNSGTENHTYVPDASVRPSGLNATHTTI